MNLIGDGSLRREIGFGFLSAIILFVVAIIVEPSFGDPSNLRSLATQAAFIGIVAIGQTIVVLAAGVDLSIPWVMGSTAIFAASLANGETSALMWVIPLLLCYGLFIGLLNGIGVTLFGVSPIIVTLAMNTVLQGATSLLVGQSLTGALPSGLANLDTKTVGPLPVDFVIWMVLAVITVVFLTYTGFGRRLYAVGSNVRVAEFAGISSIRVRIVAYMISGLTAAIAGILVAGYSGQSFAQLGEPYLFSSVAAVAIGGASILGGYGSYIGTLAGAVVLTLLAALLPILNLSAGWLAISYGLVILATLSLSKLRPDQRSVTT